MLADKSTRKTEGEREKEKERGGSMCKDYFIFTIVADIWMYTQCTTYSLYPSKLKSAYVCICVCVYVNKQAKHSWWSSVLEDFALVK